MSISNWNDQSTALLSYGYKLKSGTRSSIIYIVILSMIILSLSFTPFISIQISINSRGVIQSELERIELFAAVSGRVIELSLKDNQTLSKGDTILIVDSSLPRQQRNILSKRSKLLLQLLEDSEKIVRFAGLNDYSNSKPEFLTDQYKASWVQFLYECKDRQLIKNQAERTYNRYRTLHENTAVSLSEIEKFKFEYDKAISDQSIFINRQKSTWEIEAAGYRAEISELYSREAEVNEQNKLFTLRAPVDGSIQNLTGLRAGSQVFSNQKIAEISPNAQLFAICYVDPSDIGLIRKGQTANFQVDAFNYNQWGLISGKVIEISDDIIINDSGSAAFKVRCSLDQDYLELKNHFKGYLRKGMSFTVRFNVAERTLFQLLYDKLDNWLNPNLIIDSPEP